MKKSELQTQYQELVVRYNKQYKLSCWLIVTVSVIIVCGVIFWPKYPSQPDRTHAKVWWYDNQIGGMTYRVYNNDVGVSAVNLTLDSLMCDKLNPSDMLFFRDLKPRPQAPLLDDSNYKQ